MQWIGNYYCSKAIAEMWGHIILVWEWADEIFAWYNTFERVYEQNINQKCLDLLKDMEYRQMRRPESIGMAFTLEVRQPYFDTKLVELAFSIPWTMKIKHQKDWSIITKHIMREVSKNLWLPEYIYSRKKLAFANGANVKVWHNYKEDDSNMMMLMKRFLHSEDNIISADDIDEYELWSVTERYFYWLYKRHWLHKLRLHWWYDRTWIKHSPIDWLWIVKDTLVDR